MISKAQVKHIRSLDDKKVRYECKQFVIEGDKMVSELLKSDFEIVEIFALPKWISRQASNIAPGTLVSEINQNQLEQMSKLTTTHDVIALVGMPVTTPIPEQKIAIAVDNLQDPGNLGSIIRIADWYGIDALICNSATVDVYNSKVIQATMGSIFRVQCYYTDLQNYFLQNELKSKYACVLDGKNVNEYAKITEGIIVIGNEARGIDHELVKLCNHKITIPRKGRAESLNAAVATGIVCNTLLF